ncbi:MAG TPA: sulfotransferase, partial [Ktedonobacter sp.]|nr:sulfotransferase [Ktedonobacter sp.]
MEVFGKEHVKVVLYEDLVANAGQTLHDIFAFLGV